MKKIFKFKKEIICVAIMFVFLFVGMFLSSCGLEKLESIEVVSKSQDVYIGNFNYDDYKLLLKYDNGRTEEVALTADMISDVDRLNLYNEGKHDIKITYKEKETTFNVNVKRNVFEGVIFDDVETVYTGQDVTMTVKNVPEGTTVSYPGSNKFRNAGTYEVKAILRKDSFEAVELTAKLVIKKADYDLSEVKFEDKTVDYTGSKYNIKVEGNLPSGIAVDYTIAKDGGKEENGNSAQNAGTYVIKATFSGDYNNYNVIETKYATLTINKASIDMSSVEFNDDVVTYDRQSHSLAIQGNLPAAVSVSYENNNQIDVGEYEVIAKFNHRDSINYESIPDMKAYLTIDKADYDLSNIHFDSISADYDGKEKNIVLDGVLPTHLKYEFENNGHTDSGTYDVTVKFTNDDPNYNTPEDIKTKIVINPVVANLDEVVFERTRFVGFPIFSYYEDDLYIDVNNFRPTNLPVGLEVDKIVYYKQDGLLTGGLDEFDGVTGNFVEKIEEDGYYVAVATFKETINYKDVYPVKTQIRATSVLRDIALSGYYDADWGWNTNLNKKTLSDSLIKLEYDDCSILTLMLNDNVETDNFFKHSGEEISGNLLTKFDRLGSTYSTINNSYFNKENIVTENNEFFNNLYTVTEDLFLNATDDLVNNMLKDIKQNALIGINNQFDILINKGYVYVKEPIKGNLGNYKEYINGKYVATSDLELDLTKTYYQEATYDDYLLMIARLFGYEIYDNNNDISVQKLKENAQKLADLYLEKKDIENRLACDGAVYTKGNCFILPYVYGLRHKEGAVKEYDSVLVTYLIISDDGKVSFWVNDINKALEITHLSVKPNTELNILTSYTRCALFETQEKGAYCISYHDAAVIVLDGKEQILKHGEDILGVDIPDAEFAATSNGKLCFKLLTELPEGETIDNENIWSYEDFIKGIKVDGNELAPFDGVFKAYIDLYHGVINVYDIVVDENGNWIDFKVKYADEIKPIIAVQGLKNVSNSTGEFLVYVDIVDSEGFKMDGAWYSTIIIMDFNYEV